MEYIIAMEYNFLEAKYQHPPPGEIDTTTTNPIPPGQGMGPGEIDLIPILSIDGGGIRGIIPGVILEYLEEKLKEIDQNQKAKLADYFDVIAGTSTGGLVATLLTTPKEHGSQEPKFTAKKIVQFYLENAPKIFDQSRFSWWPKLLRCARQMFGPLYDGKELRRVVNEFLGMETRLSDTLTNVVIPTFDIQTMKPVIFSSFKVPEHPNINASMYDICIATSAAPTYLPGHKFSNGNRNFNLVDGGVAANNPTAVAIDEVLRHVGKKHNNPTAVAIEEKLAGTVFSSVSIEEVLRHVEIEKKKKRVMQDLKRQEQPEYSDVAIEKAPRHVGMQDLNAIEETLRRVVIEKKKKHNNPTAVALDEAQRHVGILIRAAVAIEEAMRHVEIEKKKKRFMQDLKRPEQPEYSDVAIEKAPRHVGMQDLNAIEEALRHVEIEKKKKRFMQDLKRPEQSEYSGVAMEEKLRRVGIEKKKKHNNPTAVEMDKALALWHVTIEKKKKHVNTAQIHPYSQFLVLSLGTGTSNNKSTYDAETSSKWGLFDWVVSNGNPLIKIFMQASEELVDYRVNNVFNIIHCPDQFLRIQDDSLTGDLPSVDIATEENLNALKKVGTNLLGEKVRRLNPKTGNYDPVPNGDRNREALDKFAKRLSDIRKSRVEKGSRGLATKKDNVISLVEKNITFMSRVNVRK